jgi:NTP pyrophosphatase (non-canonical NTP hydrolase)
MELNQYQEKAMSTCMPSCENISYMLLNLVGEVGEFASKIAKQIRKGNLTIGSDKYPNCLLHGIAMEREVHDTINAELKKEAGDILWQLTGLCKVMGWELEDVAQVNLDKLAARKAAGTIDGSGDGIIRDK